MIWSDGRHAEHVRGGAVQMLVNELQKRSGADEMVLAARIDDAGADRADVPVVIETPPDASGEQRRHTAAVSKGVLWIGALPKDDIRTRLGLDDDDNTPLWVLLVTDADYLPDAVKDASGADAAWVVSPLLSRHRKTFARIARVVNDAVEGGLRHDTGDAAGDVTRSTANRASRKWLDRMLDVHDVEEYTICGSTALHVAYAGGEHAVLPSPVTTDDELISEMKFIAAYGEKGRSHRFDNLQPSFDLLYGDRWRAHGEAWVTSPPTLALRYNRGGDITLDTLDVADSDLLAMLKEAVAGTCRLNIVIGAAMGGGKTTLCQALLAEVSEKERIDTIEDTPELRLRDYGLHPYTFERLCRGVNSEGRGAVTMSDHLRMAKRAATTKLVIGETRGEGTLDVLDAMSSGISGCLVTLHSPPGDEVLEKVVSYAVGEGASPEYAHRLIDRSIDLVVWMHRQSGRRYIADVSQVVGLDENSRRVVTEPLWQRRPGDKFAVPVGTPKGPVRLTYIAAGLRHLLAGAGS